MQFNYNLIKELKPEIIQNLYWNKDYSLSKIAEIYKTDSENIRRLMIKLDIPRRMRHKKRYNISKSELIELYYKNKMSTIEISKKYRCSQWLIWKLLKQYNLKARNANDYHRWKEPPNQIKPILNVNQNLSYLISVILGDGWTYKRKYNYFVCLEALDSVFCYKFKESLNKIGLNPSVFKNGNCLRVVGSSKIFYEWFESLKEDDIIKIAKKYPVDFIRGFYESEGNFSVYKSKKYNFISSTITIVNTNKYYMDLVRELLESLNFHPTIHIRHNKHGFKSIWALSIARKFEVKRFFELIKPSIKIGEKRRNRNI